MKRPVSLSLCGFLAVSALAGDALGAPLFSEQWENGSGAWTVVSGGPIDLVTDNALATHTYQHETQVALAGRVRATATLTVTGNTTYCLSAWVRAGGMGCPFLGTDTNLGEHWLIGAVYMDGYGGQATVVPLDGAWHWSTKQFTTSPNETWLRVKDEMYCNNPGTADFDQIELSAGPCPATPRVVDGETVFCKAPMSVATTANTCIGCNGDNGSASMYPCTTTNPYCKSDGACGKCNGVSDCAMRPGKFCSPNTGACVTTCESDGQCASGEWCVDLAPPNMCQPKTANGQTIPGGSCSDALAVRACASGACDKTTNQCGPAVDGGSGACGGAQCPDGSVGGDAGGGTAGLVGCSCNASNDGGTTGVSSLLVFVFGALARRRRKPPPRD
jgi:uncharacterized protein (TIGR03382 family)